MISKMMLSSWLNEEDDVECNQKDNANKAYENKTVRFVFFAMYEEEQIH